MNSIQIQDLPILKEKSIQAYEWLLTKFPHDNLEKQHVSKTEFEFPIRWTMEWKGHGFEWVVSDMGSVTLRLGELDGKRKSPAPIFYLSLRKKEGDTFDWTDPEGNSVPFPEGSILVDIENRIQLYIDSVGL
ncbi:LIC_13241 domain-containing protein [Leptospira limi]|uniref:Uncharacterized protein n=1 Tax=Leptospira limi TaxID=2950023 RepID=A0ABT3LVA1_9LEPT|nr:hypothetical protein [Leptospira limi]MCW7461624.1 hypothetical protein [Leptospira limi]